MGSKGGGSQTSQTVQSNEPPAWARPLLEKSAGEAMKFYDQGIGYNVYEGPTQAPLSDQTLGGMNALMAATGGGPGITNVPPEEQFPEVFKMFEQQEKQKEKRDRQRPERPPRSGVEPGWWRKDWGYAQNPYGEKPPGYLMSDDQYQRMVAPIDQGGRNINLPPGHPDFMSRASAFQSDPMQFTPAAMRAAQRGPGPSFPPVTNLPPGVDQPFSAPASAAGGGGGIPNWAAPLAPGVAARAAAPQRQNPQNNQQELLRRLRGGVR